MGETFKLKNIMSNMPQSKKKTVIPVIEKPYRLQKPEILKVLNKVKELKAKFDKEFTLEINQLMKQ